MQQLIQEINKLAAKFNLEERTQNKKGSEIDILLKCPILNASQREEIDIYNKLKTLDKIREVFFQNINVNFYDRKIFKWIINDWGGIKNFNINKLGSDKNFKRINFFLQEIQNADKAISKDSFQVISSLSKVASFFNYNEYFVYDSRAIFSLNWLIFKTSNEKQKFFPMPSGRNQEMKKFDINTIINFYYHSKNEYPEIFYKDEIAYGEYCKLIKQLSKKLNKKFTKPFHLEMFLFHIADCEIIADIKKSIKITLT